MFCAWHGNQGGSVGVLCEMKFGGVVAIKPRHIPQLALLEVVTCNVALVLLGLIATVRGRKGMYNHTIKLVNLASSPF